MMWQEELLCVVLWLGFPVLTWWMPGYFASRWLLPRASALERAITTVGLAMALVTPVLWLVPFFTRTPLNMGWALGGAVTLSIVWALGARLLPLGANDSTAPNQPAPLAHDRWVVLGVGALAMTFALGIDPRWTDATFTWWPCPHMAVLYMLEDGSGEGLRSFSPEWGDDGTWVRHVFSHWGEPGYDLQRVLSNQRPGSASTLVLPVLFHSTTGLVVATFCYYLALGLGAAGLLALHLRSRLGVIALTGLFLLAVSDVGYYMVNENVLSVGMSTLALYCLLRWQRPETAAAAGAMLAMSIATRPLVLAFIPAALMLLACQGERRLLRATGFMMGLVALVLPWLVVHDQVFGAPVVEPSLAHAQTQVEILGHTVRFHPLNWPFADELMRGRNEPWPMLITVPLMHLGALGAFLVVLAIAGARVIGWRIALGAALWAAPTYAVLVSIVSLDLEKLSYGILAWAPLPLLVGAGASALWRGRLRRSEQLGLALVGVGLFVGFPSLVSGATFEPDPRPQYDRQNIDPPVMESVEEKRDRLLSMRFLPRWTLDFDLSPRLVTKSRPAQRSEPVLDSPIIVWGALQNWVDHTVEVRTTSAQPFLSPRLAVSAANATARGGVRYLPIILKLRASRVRARLHFDGRRIDLELNVLEPAVEERWLHVAVVEYMDDALVHGSVTLDGQALPVEMFLFEHLRAAPTLLMISNSPLHYRPVGDRFEPTFEPWPSDGCKRVEIRGFAYGTDGWSYRPLRRGQQPFRVTRSQSIEAAKPNCKWTRL